MYIVSKVFVLTLLSMTNGFDDVDEQSMMSSVYVSECRTCWNREAKRYHDIETIKATILRKLRLTRPPNITVPSRPPNVPFVQQYLDDEEMMNDSPWSDSRSPSNLEDADGMTTERIIHFALPVHRDFNVLRFELQRQVMRSENVRAYLGLYVRLRPGWPRYVFELAIHRLVSSSGDRQWALSKTIPVTRPASGGGWHRFDMTGVVNAWKRDPGTNYGLQVIFTERSGRSAIALHPSSTSVDYSYRPYLEVQIREQTSIRPRRTASLNCDEFGADKRCCRYPLIVDFQSFQWNWIIAPKRYAAFYCSGDCPFRYFTTYPHGAIVQMEHERQSTSNSSSTLSNYAGPCCAPVKTSNISMLYYNDAGNVVLSILPDMVVDQCGCS